jgi:hypothetical protein
MAIGSGGSLQRPWLTGSAGRGLPARGQKFALDLKEAGFDGASTTKSPQQAGQPVSERKLEHRSRINTGDEGALERSVGLNMFESLDDGLVSKAVTPSAAA